MEQGGRLIIGPVSVPELVDALAKMEAAGLADVAVVHESTDRNCNTRYILYVEQEHGRDSTRWLPRS